MLQTNVERLNVCRTNYQVRLPYLISHAIKDSLDKSQQTTGKVFKECLKDIFLQLSRQFRYVSITHLCFKLKG